MMMHDLTRELLVDIFHVSDGPVLHVICAGTKYQLGTVLTECALKDNMGHSSEMLD